MEQSLYGSDLWTPALNKFAEATRLTVELFDVDGRSILSSAPPTPLVALFKEYGCDPGLFGECARRCLAQTTDRPAVVLEECHGLTVVGTSLMLEGVVVGAATAGYALAQFSHVAAAQRWAKFLAVPFDRLWNVVRRQSPAPERRLRLDGELLQVLGDALLRENHRTRQYEETAKALSIAAAAKNEFLAVLSHELRTPLSAILTWASVLKLDQRPERALQAADAIARNVSLQTTMIEDLLDVNRIEHGTVKLDRQPQNLSVLVSAAVEASTAGLGGRAPGVDIIDADDPLFVQGDAGRLQQVFQNVVSNAVKFTPREGRIAITLGREATNALVVVTDTGIGIAPDSLPSVFDMFWQQEHGTRRSNGGLGIGLALVKRLTELHGGTVDVTSAGVGHGTEVVIRLPLAAEGAAPSDVPHADAEPSLSAVRGLSILIVEDSDDSSESMRVFLEHLGAAVAIARDGREALDLLSTAAPDLVLCDLRMPRMDGFEFIHELHRGPSSPPVVAMSALASDTDRQRTRDAGFECHIAKPFDEATIVAAVAATVRHRQRPLHS